MHIWDSMEQLEMKINEYCIRVEFWTKLTNLEKTSKIAEDVRRIGFRMKIRGR